MYFYKCCVIIQYTKQKMLLNFVKKITINLIFLFGKEFETFNHYSNIRYEKCCTFHVKHIHGKYGSAFWIVLLAWQAHCPLRLLLKSIFLLFSECVSVWDLSVHIVGLWDDLRPIGWTTSRAQSIAPPAQRLQC